MIVRLLRKLNVCNLIWQLRKKHLMKQKLVRTRNDITMRLLGTKIHNRGKTQGMILTVHKPKISSLTMGIVMIWWGIVQAYMVCCLRSLIINILFKVLHLFTYIFCMLVFLAVLPLGSLYTPPPSKRKKNLVRKRFQIHWQKLLYSIIYVAVRRKLEKKIVVKIIRLGVRGPVCKFIFPTNSKF